MSVYRLGSNGDGVRRIQQRLEATGIYGGPLDGVFGGGTEAAVKLFQGKEGLHVDGAVGPRTWKALFDEKTASDRLSAKSLDYRCLALTGSFETGAAAPACFAGLAGDFDDQGISFGALQWNFGQGTLQPLLKRVCAEQGEMCRTIFGGRYRQLTAALDAPREEQMAFARSIQEPDRKTVNEPWRGMFTALGNTEEFQRIETDAANAFCKVARRLCAAYGLWSERAVALMFDIAVQNGSIGSSVEKQIRTGFAALSKSLSDEDRELEQLRIVANRRAEAARARFVEDVRSRKLCIANGKGTVHGIPYDLAGQFGIGLRRCKT